MSEFEVPDEAMDPAELAHGIATGPGRGRSGRGGRPPVAVAYVPDLIDRSKVAGAVPGVQFVARPGALEGCRAPLVIVDLGRAGVLDVLPRVPATRVVGFASHVDTDTLAAAQAAGCEAMPRSAFFARLHELTPPP